LALIGEAAAGASATTIGANSGGVASTDEVFLPFFF